MLPALLRRLVREVVPPSVVLWRQALYARKYGERELDLISCLCDPNRTSVDIGANEGLYCNRMRALSRKTHAFEAVKSLADELRWKFGQSVTVHHLAVSSRSGRGSLKIPVVGGMGLTGLSTLSPTALDASAEIEVEDVDLCRLDDVPLGDVGFIKIDVEGHEGAVLEGATATIERCRPNILVEAEERHSPGTIAAVGAFFAARRSSGVFVRHDELRPFHEFDLATMQNPRDFPEIGSVSHRGSHNYVNNFIFLPNERAETTRGQIKRLLKVDAAA
jgi:FkbM family methyltransferase